MAAERSILVTGCSSGIGLDAARSLRARGWRVFATCRRLAVLRSAPSGRTCPRGPGHDRQGREHRRTRRKTHRRPQGRTKEGRMEHATISDRCRRKQPEKSQAIALTSTHCRIARIDLPCAPGVLHFILGELEIRLRHGRARQTFTTHGVAAYPATGSRKKRGMRAVAGWQARVLACVRLAGMMAMVRGERSHGGERTAQDHCHLRNRYTHVSGWGRA